MNNLFNSFRYAMRGLRVTWKEEHNFRIEVLCSILVLLLIILFKFSFVESIFMILSVVLVLSAEIINTAIEDLSDMVEPNVNPLIGKIKDTMAGFVLVMSLGAVIIGIMVVWNHFGI